MSVRRIQTLLPPAVALLLFAGCVTGARYQINVGNGNPRLAVQNVKVEADRRDLSEFEVIAPSKVAASKPFGGKLPETLLVRWTDPDGGTHEQELAVSGRVRQGFKGQLIVEITEDNQLTLTQVESSGAELSTLPWAMPESWEGTMELPGME